MPYSHILGQIVISSSFGIGRVTEVDEENYGPKPFIVVECQDQKAKYFAALDDKKSYRLVSSKEKIDQIILTLKDAPEKVAHESKKDRINYFKTNSQIQDVDLISKLIRELYHLTDRGSAEEQILNRLIDTLALEYKVITDVSLDDAKKLLFNSLK